MSRKPSVSTQGPLCNSFKDCYTEFRREKTEKHRVESDMIFTFELTLYAMNIYFS